MSDSISYEVSDRIATITIDRPEARNALDLGAVRDLVAAVYRMDTDDDVDVGILCARGATFCAGLDLKALSSGEIDLATNTRDGNPWTARVKPLLAAVNGPAITGGLELVLNCDVAVASSEASFADTHTRVGILPFWGLSVLLPRAVGARNAALMTLTGNFVDAAQALTWGLVAEVVEPGDLAARTRELALDIAGNDQPGVRAMLALYRDAAGLPVTEAQALEVERALAWQGEGFDAAEIGRRFEAIKARGRTQRATSGS